MSAQKKGLVRRKRVRRREQPQRRPRGGKGSLREPRTPPRSLPLFLTATPVLPHGHPSLGKPGGRRLLAALEGLSAPNFESFLSDSVTEQTAVGPPPPAGGAQQLGRRQASLRR